MAKLGLPLVSDSFEFVEDVRKSVVHHSRLGSFGDVVERKGRKILRDTQIVQFSIRPARTTESEH